LSASKDLGPRGLWSNWGTLRLGPEALQKLMHAVHKEIACM